MPYLRTHWGHKGIAKASAAQEDYLAKARVELPEVEIMCSSDDEARRACDSLNDMLAEIRTDGAAIYVDGELWESKE